MVAPEPMYLCPDDPMIAAVPESELTGCDYCGATGIDPMVLRRFDIEQACRICEGLGKVIGYVPNGFGAIGTRVLRAVRVETCPEDRASGVPGHVVSRRDTTRVVR